MLIGANAFGEFSKSVLPGCVPGVPRSDHIRSIRSGPRRPEGCESCTGRAAAPFPLGAETSRAGRLEGVRVFSGTAGTCRATVRNPGALRGRLGAGVVAYVPRYGAYVTLSGPHGKRLCFRCIVPTRRFPGGMRRPHILRSVEELRVMWRVFRAGGASVCFGMRRYGSPVRCGFWHGMSRYGAPEVVRYVSLCFAMFRSLLRLGPPALSRRRRSSRLRDVALCRALSRAGDLRRSRPHFQWNGCRVCCVGFALFRIGRDFFQGTGPRSRCRCPNTRR